MIFYAALNIIVSSSEWNNEDIVFVVPENIDRC